MGEDTRLRFHWVQSVSGGAQEILRRRVRVSCVLLATMTLLFGLQIFRAFLPPVLWFLGQSFSAAGLVIYALITFGLTLLAPLVRRGLGEQGALALSVSGVALVRIAIQVVRSPLFDLLLASAGLAFLGWFLPLWCQSRRNCPGAKEIPALAIAFPLAFLIDTGSRSLLLSYDLMWRYDAGATWIVGILVGATLALLWWEVRNCPMPLPRDQGSEEPTFSCVFPMLGLGPWLYVAMTITHNPSALAAATGWGYREAHLTVNAFSALGALVGIWVAGWSVLQRWHLALMGGGLLVGALALFVAGIGPAWLWVGLASLNSWAALGEVMTSTARTGPLQPGLWRSGVVTFLALATLLAIVVLVIGYGVLWATPLAGAVLGLAALWATRVEAGRDGTVLRARSVLVGTAGVGVLLAVVAWALVNRPTEIVKIPVAGQPLRVMTYNIHHGIDADFNMDVEAISDVIAAEDPDVVVLNEVNRARLNNGFVDTLLLISQRLKLTYVFGANFQDGLYGNALLSRYPILAWDNIRYNHNTTEVRGLLRVVVQVGDAPITFYATHLDHLHSPDHARAEQVAQALITWDHAPRAVLLGDLNADPDAPELKDIYDAGFLDALEATGQDDAFTSWDPKSRRRIDYIFLTPDLTLDRSWVVESRASDHLPVLVDVRQ